MTYSRIIKTSASSIRVRLIWITVLIALGSVAFLFFFYHSFSKGLRHEKKAQSKYMSEVGMGVIKHFYHLAQTKKISDPEARELAMGALESATYQDNGYFWINNGDGVLIMQPWTPERVGINQINWTDANGKYIFQDFVRIAKNGGGWVSYYWPKPESKKEYPKISYISYFEPWNWVLGTGVYLDDMQKNVFWVVFKATGILIGVYILYVFLAVFAAGFFVRQLSDLAITDPLTGLHTKRFLKEVLPSMVKKNRRDQDLFIGAAFIDIDYFKKINDTWGHAVGDRVLAEVAGIMKSTVRPDDICVRYGGEEFVIVGFFDDRKAMVSCVERIRELTAGTIFKKKAETFNITLSAGIAVHIPGDDFFGATLKRADKMLYKAKNNGRNCVEID